MTKNNTTLMYLNYLGTLGGVLYPFSWTQKVFKDE